MPRQRLTIAHLDELRLRLLDTVGQDQLRVAGDGALVRLPDGTLGVVATVGQTAQQVRVLTQGGSAVLVDGNQMVQVLAYPVLAAKLLIHLARTLSTLDQTDEL